MYTEWIPSQEELMTIYDLKRNGIRDDSIARLLGIHPSTFSRKRKEIPILEETIKKAQAHTEKEVLGALFAMIRDPKHKQHATAVIFYCKTQLGFKEQSESQEPREKPSKVAYEDVA